MVRHGHEGERKMEWRSVVIIVRAGCCLVEYGCGMIERE
jgi:hypothetical protein